jgi:3',5'-cyclic-AMP phosphodiesterase
MRIAHLSDLHLSLTNRRENIRNLRRILEHLSRSQTDHIVVTGDIAANAEEEELQLARSIFEAYGLFHRDRLTVIPGNHDIFGGVHTAEDALKFPGRCQTTPFAEKVAAFYRVFHQIFEGCVHASRQHPFPFVKVVRDVALIGLNSVAEHSRVRNPFGSNGTVGTMQRLRMEELLDSGLLAGKRRVVLVHHHFHKPRWEGASGMAGLWLAVENQTMKLRKKRTLLKLLRRHHVDAVLHGHHHQNCEYRREGIRFLNGGGCLMGPDPSALYVNTLTIDGARIRTDIQTIPAASRGRRLVGHVDRPTAVAA